MNAQIAYLERRIVDLERKLAIYEKTQSNPCNFDLATEPINVMALPTLPPVIQLHQVANMKFVDDMVKSEYHLVV